MGLMLGIVVDKDESSCDGQSVDGERRPGPDHAGTEAIRLLPPLVITKEEMDEAIDCYEGGILDMKHLLKLLDCTTGGDYLDLLDLADQLKYERKHHISHRHLEGKSIGHDFPEVIHPYQSFV